MIGGLDISVAGFTLRPEASRPESRSGWDGAVSSFSSVALGGPDISTAGLTLSPAARRPESLSLGADEGFAGSAGRVLGAGGSKLVEAGLTLRPEASNPERRSGCGGVDLLPVTDS